MNERLNSLVDLLRKNLVSIPSDAAGPLSTGEHCYVALAANRYDLLPNAYDDPIDAWHRLDARWRTGVCEWRDWPLSWAAYSPPTTTAYARVEQN